MDNYTYYDVRHTVGLVIRDSLQAVELSNDAHERAGMVMRARGALDVLEKLINKEQPVDATKQTDLDNLRGQCDTAGDPR
ncbi:hypothetical protein [Caballeronia sp. TF1N1]|uniref:hypothetical protein n=1 Tax=Caballeronia sp. TF1N1 TaxID=2878153 RepID=UPI001FD05029|nr:hypothetical protein [Caballeronia sp. TF1N1]